MLWNCTVETIPSGWHLCDGTVGTPDLMDFFIRGAGESYAPNQFGGTTFHSHEFTGDGHDHDIPQSAGCPGAGPNPCLDGLKTSEDPSVGTTENAYHVPPWYALCYIMKL